MFLKPIKELFFKIQMLKHQSREKIVHVLLFLGILISRFPFIEYGYGIDPDAWRVASVANTIYTTRDYVASRLPGYPVQEITYALLPFKNAEGFNFFDSSPKLIMCIVF